MKKPEFEIVSFFDQTENLPSVKGILTKSIQVELVSQKEVVLEKDTAVEIYMIGAKRVANYSGNYFEIRDGEFLLAA